MVNELPQVPVRPTLFSERLAGPTRPDRALVAGVPAFLDGRLRAWARAFITAALAARIAVHLQRRLDNRSELAEAVDAARGVTRHLLIDQLTTPMQLLDAVDLALQLDRDLHIEVAVIGKDEDLGAVRAHNEVVVPAGLLPACRWPQTSHRARAVEHLDQLLDDARSLYTVSWDPHPPRLVTRTDPTVAAAAEAAIDTTADPAAQHLLAKAWHGAHYLHPDTAAVYDAAIRAVEQVLCPLIRPGHLTATHGDVIRRLDKDHREGRPDEWAFALHGRDGLGDIGPFFLLIQRLWQGHHARHGGQADCGPPSVQEARAAAQLAVVIVGLVNDGALTRRTS